MANFFSDLLKGTAKTVLPKELEYKFGLTPKPKAMTFEVGEGLEKFPQQQAYFDEQGKIQFKTITPERQKLKAEEKIRQIAETAPPKRTNFFADVARMTPRAAAAFALERYKRELVPTTKAERFLFGEEPIKPITEQYKEAKIILEKADYKKTAAPIAGLAVFGGAVLDLTFFGGGKKQLVNQLVRETTETGIRKILTKTKVADDIIERYAKELAETKSPKVVERVLSDIQRTTKIVTPEVPKAIPKEVKPKLPKLPPIVQKARQYTPEDLKELGEQIKRKDITEEQFSKLSSEVAIAEEAIETNPVKELAKYSPSRGEFAGVLPEVTGEKGKGLFVQRGDDIVTELGFRDSEQAREAFEKYIVQKETVQELKQSLTNIRKTKAAVVKGEKLMTLAKSDRRIRFRALKNRYNLIDADLSKIRANRDISIMSKSEFADFIQKAEVKAGQIEKLRQSRIQLEGTIHQKELTKWQNVQKAMKLPPINKMSSEQMNKLDEVLSKYKSGDEFLTTRQLETIETTELKGLRTVREAREHLAKKYNISVSDLPNIKPHPWMYDTQLARQHPLYDLLVDKYNVGYLKASGRTIELEKEIDGLIRNARKSRGRLQFIPTDKKIVDWLGSDLTKRKLLMEKMTGKEITAAQRMDEIFREYYEWLSKRSVDKKFSSRFEDKYFPHVRRGFLEAWKESGFLKASKEAFDQFKQIERTLTILDEKTGEILPYEKWVGFTQFRTGELVPTKNASAAFKSYITALEKARQFDEFIPEMMIYVHSLTPKALTPRGLKVNDSLQRFVKSWINSKKGRVQKQIVKPGSKIDWALRMGVAITRIKDLGLNVPIGIANIFGEQAGNITMLRARYPIGVSRFGTKQGQAIIKKYESFIGRSFFEKMKEASTDVGDKLLEGIFGLFSAATRKGNQVFLLGSMTKEEFAKGIISVERLAKLRKLQGKYRVVEGAQSIIGRSAEASVGGQYKKWAIPAIVSTASNARKLVSIIKNKGVKSALRSEEGAELFFSVVLGSTLGLGIMGYYRELEEKRDRSFAEDVIYKSARDALSMIGALNPRFLGSFAAPRLSSFIVDLTEALESILLLEKYKTTGKLKGIEKLKRTTTPAAIKPFLREEKEKKPFKVLPKLPSLPSLPKLPSLKL